MNHPSHCLTASPLSFVVVYPHAVMWLLKYPITIVGGFPYPSAGSTHFLFAGL